MNKTIAFYDPYVTGHHVEYLFHIAINKNLEKFDDKFLFFVSRSFNNHISQLISIDQLKKKNIEIIHIEDLINDINFKFEQTLECYKLQLIALNDIVKLRNIHHCVFMYLDNAMQIALSSLAGKSLNCQLSGIVLNPFGGYGSGLTKYYYTFRKILQNYIMLSNPKITGIYIIINNLTAKRLNLIHFSKKFKYVSDPILKSNHLNENVIQIKEPNERITFLLFGSLNKRKGIFKTLNAVNKLMLSDLNKIKIVFAGRISEQDKDQFLEISNHILSKDSNSIVINDKFIEYKDIPIFFNQSDYILLPYDATQASSGILGHAAYFKKPIIGQGGGVFEKDVNNYSLGRTIHNLDEDKLFETIKSIIKKQLKISIDPISANKYLNLRDGVFFANTIINTAQQ